MPKLPQPLLIGTNLKMYMSVQNTLDYLQQLSVLTRNLDPLEATLFVIPSFTALHPIATQLKTRPLLIGAQNMFWEDFGPYTGEISPLMLKELGVKIVELGHSERRQIFSESDEMINRKIQAALHHGFVVLFCVGEDHTDKRNGNGEERVRQQIVNGLKDVTPEQLAQVWIAYEPAWAIGEKGTPALPDYANRMHALIFDTLQELYPGQARSVPILYGGSVNQKNAPLYIQQEYIHGLFIGRSAWKAESFNSLIRLVLKAWHEKQSSNPLFVE